MARAATAFVDFEGDFSKVGRSAGVQSKKLEGTFNSSFKRIASFAAGSLAAIGVGQFLKGAFKEAEEAQKVSKQTAAVLKSTGGIAKVSSKQVDSLAQSLSNVAAVDDEVIQQGENVLLTFTGIRNEAGKGNDVFNQATTAALNMSAALGTDLQGSVIQVGKALNDPIKGITALSRVGVSFTKQQKDQIKTLVESGKTLEAQKLILKELGTEFGGAAEAAATPSARFKVAIDNLKESLGTFLLPVFEKLAGFMAKTLVPALQEGLDTIKRLGAAIIIAFKVGFGGDSIRPIKGWLSVFAKLGALIRGFVDFIKGDIASAGVQLGKVFGLEEDDPRVKSMINALGLIRKALVSVVQFIQRNWKPILIIAAAALLLFIAPVVAVVAGLAILYVRFKVVRQIVKAVADGIKTAIRVIQTAVAAVASFFEAHQKDFEAIGKRLAAIGKAIIDVFKAVAPLVKAALAIIVGVIFVAVKIITDLWNRFGDTILDKIRIAFNAVVTIVQGAMQVIQGLIEIITGILTLNWSKTWKGIQNVFGGVWKVILGILTFAINHISSIIAVGMGLVSAAWGAIWDGMKFVVGSAIEAVVGFFKNLPARLLSFVKSVGEAALAIGKAILNGITNGIKDTAGRIAAAAITVGKSIVKSVVDGVKAAAHLLLDAVKTIVNKLPGGGLITGALHKLHVPFFAEGGIVPGPPGQATLAIVHGGETVFTARQKAALIAGIGAGTGRVVDARTIVQGNVYGDSHLRAIFENHDRELVAAIGAGAR